MRMTGLMPALAAGGFTLLGSLGAAAAPPDVNGVWSGQATQLNRDKPFQVIMTVAAKGSKIEYPDSQCSGTLTRAGTSGDFVFYAEKITSGGFDPARKTGCIPGSITVQKVDGAMIWGWVGSYEGRPMVVYGTLNKTGPAPAATTAKTEKKP
jgi:hypothetical protein